MTSGGLSAVRKGRTAERRALRWLRLRGYRVIERNYRIRGGEVDVVARKANTLCFIEIKFRGPGSYFGALEALTPAQIRRIVRAADCYLLAHPHPGPCRFDVLAIDLIEGKWRTQYLPQAFDAK